MLAATLARRAAPPGAQRIMLVGNSVAYLLAPGFQKIQTSPPIAAFNLGIPACTFPPDITAPPVSDSGESVERQPCHPSWEADVIKAFRPDVVIWAVADAATHGLRLHGQAVPECTPIFDSNYEESLRAEIRAAPRIPRCKGRHHDQGIFRGLMGLRMPIARPIATIGCAARSRRNRGRCS